MRSRAIAFVTFAALGACDPRPTPTTSSDVPAVVTPNVSWPSKANLASATLAALDETSRRDVARSPVPVLVSRENDGARTTLVVDAEYYAVSERRDGVTIAVQGTKLAHRYDGTPTNPGDRGLRGTTGFVTENEGIRSASWIEGGVAYSVDVECADTSDLRCADDAFVTSVVEGLVYVGGSGR